MNNIKYKNKEEWDALIAEGWKFAGGTSSEDNVTLTLTRNGDSINISIDIPKGDVRQDIQKTAARNTLIAQGWGFYCDDMPEVNSIAILKDINSSSIYIRLSIPKDKSEGIYSKLLNISKAVEEIFRQE